MTSQSGWLKNVVHCWMERTTRAPSRQKQNLGAAAGRVCSRLYPTVYWAPPPPLRPPVKISQVPLLPPPPGGLMGSPPLMPSALPPPRAQHKLSWRWLYAHHHPTVYSSGCCGGGALFSLSLSLNARVQHGRGMVSCVAFCNNYEYSTSMRMTWFFFFGGGDGGREWYF